MNNTERENQLLRNAVETFQKGAIDIMNRQEAQCLQGSWGWAVLLSARRLADAALLGQTIVEVEMDEAKREVAALEERQVRLLERFKVAEDELRRQYEARRGA